MVGSIEVLGLLLALGLCFVADCVRVCVCVTVTGSIFWVLCVSPLSLSLSLCLFFGHVSDAFELNVSTSTPLPLLRVNCCLVYYALQIMHYLAWMPGRGWARVA